MTLSPSRHQLFTARSAFLICLAAAPLARAAVTPEVEPNPDKSTATPVNNMNSGDALTGVISNSDNDYFKITTAAAPPAIYRHRLMTFGNPTVPTTILPGLTQNGNGIQSGEGFLQASTAGLNQWYGFGKQEQLYFRVAPTTINQFTAYSATLTTDQVTPTILGTPFDSGSLKITTHFSAQFNGQDVDTEIAVYDSNFNAIPDYLNDDAPPSLFSGGTLVRNFAPGDYYLAIAQFSLATELPAAPDDLNVGGNVTDFPNVLVASSPNTARPLSVTFSQPGITSFVDFVFLTQTDPYEVKWVKFTIADRPSGACCLPDGSTAIRSSQVCQSLSGSYNGDNSDDSAVTYFATPIPSDYVELINNPNASNVSDWTSSFPNPDDSSITQFFLPFPIKFYGNTYVKNITISSNGYVTFGGTGNINVNSPLPNPAEPNNAIYGLWDDLIMIPGVSRVLTGTIGQEGSRRFIIEWIGMDKYPGNSPHKDNTFQIQFNEGTNYIDVQNLNQPAEPFPGDYTIGVENADGSRAASIPGSAIGTLGYGTRFTPVVDQCVVGSCCTAQTCSVGTEHTCSTNGGVFCGPDIDCGGYKANLKVKTFEDIHNTGSLLMAYPSIFPPNGTLDDGYGTIQLGFTFNLYGVPHTTVTISANGYVCFDGDGSAYNVPLPDPTVPNAMICPLWDDLICDYPGSMVSYQTLGTPGHRRFIAQWTKIRKLSNTPNLISTFQVALFEGSDNIEFRYDDIVEELSQNDYTIGVENDTGTLGLNIDATTVKRNTTLLLAPPAACSSVCSCPGNMNGDSSIDGADIQPFVDCLIGNSASCTCADANHDGSVDANDVPVFVQSLLSNSTCP